MIKFVLIIIFCNFVDDVVSARYQHVLTHQQRFVELMSGPELSEDEGGDDGGGDADAEVDDEVQMSSGEAGPHMPSQGNPRDAETEENLRLDAWAIIRNLDEFLIVQNQRLMDALYGNAFEQNEEMEEIIYDLADNMDHWAYRVYSKFQKLNVALEDSRYTSAKTAIIAIEGQIRKARDQLKILQGSLYSLQDKLPEEEEECAQFYTCKECLMNQGCGWCPLNDQCVAGDENGPLFAQCQHYNYQFCQGKQCLQYSACNTCLSDPDCGWCQVDEDNIKVCLQQPRNFEGCPEGSWYHIAGKQFSCPFKKKKEIMEEDVPSHKFWKRPNEKLPECKPIDEARRRKMEKQRQEYNDKSEYNSDQRQNHEVQIHFKNTLQQKVVQLNAMIEELEERKEEIEAWVQEYMASRGIEEVEVPERIPDQGEETPQEQQQENNSGSQGGGSGGGSDKIQVKRQKKKKIVQVFHEEAPSPEEEIFQEQDLAEMHEEVIQDGEEDVEYVFEMSKDFRVDFRDPHVERVVRKHINQEEIEDKKYRDQGDREIEGEIANYHKQRKQHMTDFQKYYHPQ